MVIRYFTGTCDVLVVAGVSTVTPKVIYNDAGVAVDTLYGRLKAGDRFDCAVGAGIVADVSPSGVITSAPGWFGTGGAGVAFNAQPMPAGSELVASTRDALAWKNVLTALPSGRSLAATAVDDLIRIDALLCCTVKTWGTLTTPPVPTAGDCHLVAQGASGAWTGHDGQIAQAIAGSAGGVMGWRFITPFQGLTAYSVSDGVTYLCLGSSWQPQPSQAINFAPYVPGYNSGAPTDCNTCNPGAYTLNPVPNSPPGAGWGVIECRRGGTTKNNPYDGGDSWFSQTAYCTDGNIYIRSNTNSASAWTPWYKLWHSGNGGSGSGMNSDLLDGCHASQFVRADTNTFGVARLINPASDEVAIHMYLATGNGGDLTAIRAWNFNINTGGGLDLYGFNGVGWGKRFAIDATGSASVAHNLSVGGNVAPSVANSYSCGTSSLPWTGIFTQTSPVVTSWSAAKENARKYSDAEISAGIEILEKCSCIYQFGSAINEKGPDGARLHPGFISDTNLKFPDIPAIETIMRKHGLDPARYGFWCRDVEKVPVTKTRTSQVQKTDELTRTVEKITVTDGKAVLEQVQETYSAPAFEEIPIVGADGAPIYESMETLDTKGNHVTAKVARTYKKPVMVDKTEEYTELTDNLNADGSPVYAYSLRYDELKNFCLAALYQSHAQLMARVAALEKPASA